MKIFDAEKVDWVIHGVVDSEKEEVNYHTHGLDSHGFREISIALSIPQEIGQSILNMAGLMLLEKGKDFGEMEYIEDLCAVGIYAITVNDEETGLVQTRFIFPDKNGRFPWDKNVDAGFERQMKGIDIENLKYSNLN